MNHRVEINEERVSDGSVTPWERREFWQHFKWHMQESCGIRCARVTTDGWMWHDTDLTMGNMLSMIRVRLGEIGVKYTLNDANADTVTAYLRAHRLSVDALFRDTPEWRSGGDGSHVIEVRRPMETFDRSVWPEYFSWLQRQLVTFNLALRPLVGRMPPRGETAHWDEALFMREVRTWNPDSAGAAKALLDWTAHHGAISTWGRGRCCGSFAVTIPHRGVPYQLVSARTDGTFSLMFTQLRRSPLFQDPARRLAILERLNLVHGVALPESVIESRPSLPLAMLADERVREEFLGVLGWFRDCVRLG
jgi:hypothetical protein